MRASSTPHSNTIRALRLLAAHGIALLGFSTTLVGQGVINFNNRNPPSVVAPVYGPEPGAPCVIKTGNATTNGGTQTYTGALLLGTGYIAQLWAGPVGTTEAALQPLADTNGTVRFRTNTIFAGFFLPPSSAPEIAGVPGGSQATCQLRVWDSTAGGGNITTWAQVLADPSIPRGVSDLFVPPPLGAPPATPPPLTGLTSFNLHQASLVCASDFAVECGTAWTFTPPTVPGFCGTNVTVTVVSTITNRTGFCGNGFRATRTWRGTDTCSQTVTVIDTTPPVLTCGSNRVIECGIAWTFTPPIAIDNCDATNVTIIVVGTVTNALCGNTFSATRTWRAVDGCTNSAQCSQTVFVVDTTPPAITCATNRVVECGTAWTFSPPTAIDNCDGTNVTITVVGTVTNALCGNTYSATRTWRAVDGCTNSAQCSQMVTVVDTTPPLLTCASNLVVECGSAWTFTPPTATDSCDGTNIAITIVGTVTNALCGNTYSATRTWRATDTCSNSAQCSQTVTVRDTTPPIITCPAVVSPIQCPASPIFPQATATDTCDAAPVVTFMDVTTPGACPGNHSVTRTWTARDCSSNTASCSQTVIVIDTTPPAITCATNRVVECGTAWTFNPPTATDSCDGTNVTITIVGTVTNALCGNTFSATRTWRALDSCTNSAQCSQTVTVIDTTPPAVTCATNRVVECGTAWTFTPPTATDSCDGSNVTITIVGTVTNALCGNTFSATRTWRAADSCTNSAQCSQTVTVIDITPPAITCATNRVVECGTAWTFTPPTATDSCDGTNVTITIVGTVTNALCGNTYSATRTWRALDNCTNSAQCSQTVTVIDTTPPAITCATNRVVECGTAWTFNPPTAIDSCDGTNVTITIVGTVTNALCGNTYSATRAWRATDSCTNSAQCSQTVTVIDITPPAITCATNRVVECGTAWTFTSPAATDSCDGTNVTITIVGTVTNALCGNTYSATRTWRAADSCTNSAQCSQTVTVIDITPPAITCATNRVVECGTAWTFTPPTATDSCDGTNVTITIVGTVTNALCGNTYSATRTWRAVDGCTNSAQCSQTVTVVDTTPPAISCASDRLVECGIAWTFTPPTAIDICDNATVVITVVGTVTNALCGNTYSATRTWRAVDSCTNSAQCSQTVTVIDATPPSVTCATNRVVECGTAWTFNPPTAIDSCDGTNVTITIVGTVTNAFCGNTYSATRTWRATDSCTNSAQCSQTVTVVDTTSPTITCAANRVVECGIAWTFTPPTAIDVCDGTNVAITIVGTVTNLLVGQTYSATRTWRATDACGNFTSCSQSVTLLDATPPAIACSSNIIAECGGPLGTVVNYTASASDACDTNVLLVCTPPSGSAFPLNVTTTVRCVATDDSGNTNACSFTVRVLDTTPPSMACPSIVFAAELPHGGGSAVVSFTNPVATDICDSNRPVVCVPPSGTFFPLGNSTVICGASDNAGNANTCSFLVRVIPYKLVVTTVTNDAVPGSLRQALLDANDAPGENLVVFNLPGGGPQTIHLRSPLPAITSPVIIDGWAQPGFNGTPLIELDGSGAAGADGLVINAGNCTVQGLALNGFVTAIRLQTNGGNVIRGNFIGLGPSGTSGPGNSGDGLYVSSASNSIGGTASSNRNVIALSGGSGIHFDTPGAVSNLVVGNFIGTKADGTNSAGNAQDGVRFSSGAFRNTIGGTVVGTGNVIAFNGRDGVALDPAAGAGNAIRGNSIASNTALGIDLGADGVTANDLGDADSGPNLLQNFPVLIDARFEDGITTIDGTLNSIANATYRLDFFLNDTVDPTGYGEGARYIGSASVTVGDSGSQDFSASFLLLSTDLQFVTATGSDPTNNTSEFSQRVQVRTAPVLTVQPAATNAPPGSPVTFCALASGTPPILYQWRLNGVNIPGATNPCYTIPAAQIADGGTYSAVVENGVGAIQTGPAVFTLVLPPLAGGDNFADRVTLIGVSNVVAGSNRFATRELGEPQHAGKPGGKSVWYTWQPPVTGVATVTTKGSTFDTLLGVYEGISVSSLISVASDEDRGGYYASGLRFNAIKGHQYHFAVDGYGGEEGEFILVWALEDTIHLVPVFVQQPQSQTVAPGATAMFTPIVIGAPGEELLPLFYHWFVNGAFLPGATNAALVILNVQPADLGDYVLQVSNRFQTVESDPASLQLNETGNLTQQVQAKDKFLDAAFAPDQFRLGDPDASLVPAGGPIKPAGVVHGYTGVQTFNSVNAHSAITESNICGVAGGASEWITFVMEETGVLFISTDGSSYDTVMAFFQPNPANPAQLQMLACDNNGGLDHLDSSFSVPVEAGKTNYLMVDGVNGQGGILKLTVNLVTRATLGSVTFFNNTAKLRINTHAAARFSIQSSPDLRTWTTLLTTTSPGSIFDFTDPRPLDNLPRFYRTQMLLP